MTTRRTDITVKTARVLYVSKPKRMISRCEACGEMVDWLTVDEAATLTATRSLEIFRLTERGQLHSTETVEGILVVCANSVMVAANSGQAGSDREQAVQAQSGGVLFEDEKK